MAGTRKNLTLQKHWTDGLNGRRSRRGLGAEYNLLSMPFPFSICKGAPYPKICARRILGMEDFLCCGLRQGPRPVSCVLL